MKIRLPKRRWLRVLLYVFSFVLILLAIDLLLVRIGRHITVATDTTYITSPLKPDGSPDYLQYVREQYSQGITGENNAAPLLVENFDPSLMPEKASDLTYAALGVKPPNPSEGLIHFEKFLESKKLPHAEAIDHKNDLDRAVKRFWKPGEYPLVAEYLQSQARLLADFHQAAQRPRYYVPFSNPNSDLMVSQFVPAVGGTRLAAKLMLAQAMLDASAGDFDKAHVEILDVHRMANLLAQSPTLIEVVVAMSIGEMASNADAALAAANLSAQQAKTYLAHLSALPPMPTAEHAIDKGERLFGLDCFVFASHAGMPRALDMFTDVNIFDPGITFIYHFIPVNLNAGMRRANSFYDELVAAGRLPTYAQRSAAYQACNERVVAYASESSWDPTRHLLQIIFPSLVLANDRDEEQRMHLELVRIAYALGAYHGDHGVYPQSLADLAATLPQIPQDRFTDGPLHYQKTENGYLLYSVGPNMTDDGGKQSSLMYTGDFFNAVSGSRRGPDDITISIPSPKSD